MSEAIYRLIQQHAPDEYSANDDAAVLTILNTKSIEKSDSTRRTLTYLLDNLTPEEAVVVRTVLRSSEYLKIAYDALNGTGIDLSSPKTQAMLDQLTAANAWTDAFPNLGTKLKEFGKWSVSPAEEVLERDATQDDINAARQYEAESVVRPWAAARYNAVVAAIDAGETDQAALRLVFAAEE